MPVRIALGACFRAGGLEPLLTAAIRGLRGATTIASSASFWLTYDPSTCLIRIIWRFILISNPILNDTTKISDARECRRRVKRPIRPDVHPSSKIFDHHSKYKFFQPLAPRVLRSSHDWTLTFFSHNQQLPVRLRTHFLHNWQLQPVAGSSNQSPNDQLPDQSWAATEVITGINQYFIHLYIVFGSYQWSYSV